MTQKITIGSIVKTSIVTAFTIAAALIWKDFFEAAITVFVPPGQQLIYRFLIAIIVTVLVVVAIYFILKTEAEVEKLVKEAKYRRKNRKKK